MFGSSVMYSLVLCPLLFLVQFSASQFTEYKIDDAYPEVTYSEGWNVQTPGSPCTTCTAVPPSDDLYLIYDGTWHDGTVEPGSSPITAQMVFTGTSVSAYGWTINDTTVHPYIKNQNLSFTIDSQPAGSYVYNPTATSNDAFNVQFFGVSGLPNTEHTIVMTVNPNSLALFDYFIYTQPVNVTVDDADAAITYSEGWNVPQPGCTTCSAEPTSAELQEIYDGTWHDGTVESEAPVITAQLVFKGTAVYAFGWTINATTVHPYIKNQDLSFTIDSQPAGSFVYDPTPASNDEFNVPFFGVSGLDDAEHELVMTVNPGSFVLFDYFVYTSES